MIVVEPDAARADAARRNLAENGLYGQSVQVLTGEFGAMEFTPYWADQVIMQAHGDSDPSDAALVEAFHVLRPYTGTLILAGGAGQGERVARLLAEREEYALQSDGSDLIVRREEPPMGAADWTHEAADAANRFASSDELVKWPLGVLWYSGEIDRFFTPEAHFQHERNPYPLVINGRMFVITHEKIHAVDIYTGRYFWQTKMPLTPYVAARYFDSRAYGRPTERNAVLAPDRFYAVTGSKIHAYDTATGEPREVLDIIMW